MAKTLETELVSMVEPRPAKPTVAFVDEYYQFYKSLSAEVRSFEAFKFLHLGMISDIKRKPLPAIAKAVELDNHQGFSQIQLVASS